MPSWFRLTLLDRYVLGKFLRTFGFVTLLFIILAVVVDFSEKVEDFIKRSPPAFEIFFHYYVNFIPHIITVMLPMYLMIAVIFFTSRMAYNSEVISVLNAGVSFRRFLRPYIVGSVAVALLAFCGNHIFLPKMNRQRLDFEHKYIWLNSDKGKSSDVHMFIDPNTKIYVQDFSKRDSSASGFRLEKFENKKLKSILRADSCRWLGPPNRWRLVNYSSHAFEGQKETFFKSTAKYKDTLINFTPDDFVRYLEQREMMTTPEMLKFISIEKSRGMGNFRQYQVEAGRRSTEPVSLIILTIIGAAVAARKVRGGMGAHLMTGIGLGALFIFLTKMSVALSTNLHLPPQIGVWIPNITFALIALWLYRNAQQ
jgi:lipopolysaccharide export system permease protein